MRNRVVAVVAAIGLSLSLAACGQSNGSSSGSNPTTSAQGTSNGPASSSGPAVPHDGAPKVANPIDASKWMSNPCGLVSKGQLASLGMSKTEMAPKPGQNGDSKSCTWNWMAESVGGSFQDFHGNGLSSPYQSHKSGGMQVFEPFTIDGYPAVAAQQTKYQMQQGYCGVAVGIRDNLVFFAQMQADDSSKWHKKPCDAAKKFAGVAMKTLEGK